MSVRGSGDERRGEGVEESEEGGLERKEVKPEGLRKQREEKG